MVDDKEMKMNDLALRTTVGVRVHARAASRTAIGWGVGLAHRANDRLRREQTGQDIIEYAGMLVLVAAVIAILFALNLPHIVGSAVASAVNSIFSGNSKTSYTAPTASVPNS